MDNPNGRRSARMARSDVSRAVIRTFALLAVAVLSPSVARAGVSDATLFRVFLKNGTAVVSYGEFARVGERVIFSMPIGPLSEQPVLHLVNLPASAIDWTNTERYAESARFDRYVSTRADADFAALSGEVAETLNKVALTSSPTRRLEIAEQARRKLAEWPAAHYGYRAWDVSQILLVLDEAISALRAAAGATRFDLNLVAAVAPPPPGPLLPDPTAAESFKQALAVASLTDVPAERLSLLRSIAARLETAGTSLQESWRSKTRKALRDQIAGEMSVENAYGHLAQSMLRSAATYANRADVRGVEKVLGRIRREDASLGKKRPEQINALLQEVQRSLDSARRLRLARDQWTLRKTAYRLYEGSIRNVMSDFSRMQPWLEDIKTLAGPTAPELTRLASTTQRAGGRLATVAAPEDFKPVHALMISAVQLADTAARVRQQAAQSGNLRTAWDASAAAAGSIMLFVRARSDMEALLKPPAIR